jgi:hypothetical protein
VFNVADDLTIDGPGANRVTVNGGGSTRVFSISGSETDVTISDLTIADGLATAATETGPYGPVALWFRSVARALMTEFFGIDLIAILRYRDVTATRRDTSDVGHVGRKSSRTA